MNYLGSWRENLTAFSRTAQAALLVSLAIHCVIVLLVIQLYQAPQPLTDRILEIDLQVLMVQEFVEVEELEETIVEPLVEVEVAEELSIASEEPLEEEPLPPVVPEVVSVISVEEADVEAEFTLSEPVAVLVHPDTLEEFVRADSEYTRVPTYKSFEAQLRQENYFNSWTEKVTKFGKRAIPDSTTQKTFHGEVKLHVVLSMDGGLDHVSIIDPAGLEFLNNLALSIVRMASPYAPVPRKLLNREGELVFQPKIVFRNKLAWVE